MKGTDWIETDQWTCFVGENESGKTNLLLPLWKFNPADKETKIDLFLDYPRDEYSKIDADDGARKHEPFIEVLFELDGEELNDINKNYKEYLNPTTENDNAEKEAGSEVKKDEKAPVEKIEFTQHLLIKKDYNEVFYLHLSNEKCEELSENIQENIGNKLFDKICDKIPKFVYYSEYGNLDTDIYLPRVQEDLTCINTLPSKDRMKARTLKILFGHLDLNPKEILKLGQENKPNNDPAQKTDNQIKVESRNKQERYAKVTSAASRLSTQFKDWWTQGDYIFHFNADGGISGF